tara:strand:- start:35 stop:580 length:546 start_codon:yes stop_codon:yes gene_type:complete
MTNVINATTDKLHFYRFEMTTKRKALPKNHQSDLAIRYTLRKAKIKYRITKDKQTTIIQNHVHSIDIHLKRVSFKWYEISTFQNSQIKTSLCLQYNSIQEVIDYLQSLGYYDKYQKVIKSPKSKKHLLKGGLFNHVERNILKEHYGLTLGEIAKIQALCVKKGWSFDDYRNHVFGLQMKIA